MALNSVDLTPHIGSEIKVAEATMSAREAQLDATIARWEAKQAQAAIPQEAE